MRRVGKYEICGRLGRGGMGAVYKARIPVLDKIVALKLLQPVEHMEDMLGPEAVAESFIREARIMASLRHPHIAQVWDFGEHNGRPFFTMEYACHNLGAAIGESYRTEAPSRPIRPDLAFRYATQTLSGLARMHHAGIVHRDIKPYNLLITERDRIKIIDFGLSKLRKERAAGAPPTPRGMKVGTPFYAPPEQEEAPESVDARADLFPVGVTLFRMLTGELPPEPPYSGELPIPDAFHMMSNRWQAFFSRALAANPRDRFASAKEMSEAVQEFHAVWEQRAWDVCLPPSTLFQDPAPRTEATLRAAPYKTGPLEVDQAFPTCPLDELGRPTQTPEGELAIKECPGGEKTVVDSEHGLMWRQGGSHYAMRWHEAHEHIDALNRERCAGFDDWRLPTVDELCTLISGFSGVQEYCMDTVFDRRQRILWSADRRAYTSAWHLNAALGYIGWQDMTCYFWCRAVRNI